MNIAFVGKPRTGKTLFMTYHAHQMKLLGHKIYANYQLNFPYTNMSPYEMLAIPFSEVDRDYKTLCIQEVDKWFDSRRSMTNENRLVYSLTAQAGKRNLNIFVDSQKWERIDREIRSMIDIVYHTSVILSNGEPIAFLYTLEDMNDGSVRELPAIPASMFKSYYDMYNSYQSTKPITRYKSAKEMDAILNPQEPEETEYKNTKKGKKKVVYY